MSKLFIISPRFGLCNQLQSIVKGILLSIKYKRHLYINKFQIDLNSGRLSDINAILDIEFLNNFLQKTIDTSSKIITTLPSNINLNNLHNYYLPGVNSKNSPHIPCLNDNIEKNSSMNIIYLDNPVMLNISMSFSETGLSTYYSIIMNKIKFTDIFYKLKEKIKNALNLTRYNCVHLRIEDDALRHFSNCHNMSIPAYNHLLIGFYNRNIMELIKNKNMIYICSGMNNLNNKINSNYYKNLIKDNAMIYDKQSVDIDTFFLKNRELIAIIELLIAYDSSSFIGLWLSSFSQVIKINHDFQNKLVKLYK